MRHIMALLLVAAALTGCADVDPAAGTDADDSAPSDEETTDRKASRNATLESLPQFCENNATCDFWDDMFHEYVVYDLDTYVFDVLVVPPAGASTPDNIAASTQAVEAWRDGILELAEPWLAEAFEMNIYTVGLDVPSIDAVQDPEIVVISSSAVGVLGIGLEPKQFACLIIGEDLVTFHGGHWHGDNWIGAADCTGTGFTCFAINGAASDPRGVYDLIAHEVGHCLGAGHVGDALDFRSRYAPIEDIMSYQSNPEQVHCVSNLNVRTLEGVYAHLLDQDPNLYLPRGSYLEMAPEDYMQVDCDNPPGMD